MALFAMGSAVFVIANDFSAINVALPTIESDFHTNINTIQWVVNAYAFTFGVLIVTGGRLADMFGRRVCFFLGAGDLRRDVGGRRRRPDRDLADRHPGPDGDRRRADAGRRSSG